MNENNIIKRSMQVFILGILMFGILGFFINDFSYVLGFIIGYLLNLVVFNIIIKMSESILNLSMSTPIVIIGFVGKLFIYALGFFIAIKLESVNIIGVFIGYMSTKISIYLEGYKNKGGDN